MANGLKDIKEIVILAFIGIAGWKIGDAFGWWKKKETTTQDVASANQNYQNDLAVKSVEAKQAWQQVPGYDLGFLLGTGAATILSPGVDTSLRQPSTTNISVSTPGNLGAGIASLVASMIAGNSSLRDTGQSLVYKEGTQVGSYGQVVKAVTPSTPANFSTLGGQAVHVSTPTVFAKSSAANALRK